MLTAPAITQPLNRLSGPKKLATNGLAGRAYSCAGVPLCTMRPSSITWIWSATRTASSASWVTMRTGVPVARRTAIASSRTCSRSVASRLENGSSSSIRRGRGASARASAALLLTAREHVRIALGVTGHVDLGEQLARALRRLSEIPRRPKATLSSTPRCGNSAKSWNISPTRRASGATA